MENTHLLSFCIDLLSSWRLLGFIKNLNWNSYLLWESLGSELQLWKTSRFSELETWIESRSFFVGWSYYQSHFGSQHTALWSHYIVNTKVPCCYSVTKSSLTLCEHTDCSTPGFLCPSPYPAGVYPSSVHWIGDAIETVILCRPLLLLPSIFSIKPEYGNYLGKPS